ncbi:MAG: methyl-accepting chemotaxis protein [Deltaproteobacteria bacterium]|nr:methyl-accepting chemotaxis protein [Deltaproteobacteria bacterium]
MSAKKMRRNYPLIDRSRQYRFLFTILIYNLLIVCFVAIPLFVPDILQLQDETLSLETRAVAADKILTTHARLWPALIALVCVIGLHSFRMFHRFVGPLYRLRMAFDQIRRGDLDFRVRLRKGDYLMEEEKAINDMIDVLSGRLRIIQEGSRKAMDSIKGVATSTPSVEPRTDGSNPLALHLTELQALHEATGYFHTEVPQEKR